MSKGKNRQNYPNKRQDDYFSMLDERVDHLDVDFDDYDHYEETMELLKAGKTLGGRRFK